VWAQVGRKFAPSFCRNFAPFLHLFCSFSAAFLLPFCIVFVANFATKFAEKLEIISQLFAPFFSFFPQFSETVPIELFVVLLEQQSCFSGRFLVCANSSRTLDSRTSLGSASEQQRLGLRLALESGASLAREKLLKLVQLVNLLQLLQLVLEFGAQKVGIWCSFSEKEKAKEAKEMEDDLAQFELLQFG